MEDYTNDTVTPYYPSKTITKLFVQIEKGIQIADEENTPLTNARIIAKAYLLVQKLDYIPKNTKLGIAVQKKKRSGSTSAYNSLNNTMT